MWRRLDLADGLAHGVLSDLDPRPEDPAGGILLDGAGAVRDDHGPWSVRFSVITDRGWRTRSAFVEVLGPEGLERVTLEVGATGTWTVDGRPWPPLDGASDVDVSASPMTNTMPVRRLNLGVGEEAEIVAAWVDTPSLAVHRVHQTYRRLPDLNGLAAFQYTDPGYGPFTLTVDALGMVVDYQSLFARVA